MLFRNYKFYEKDQQSNMKIVRLLSSPPKKKETCIL